MTEVIRPKKPQPKGGSRKGIPNKATAELKTMVLQALEGAGGVQYLQERAEDPRTASAFLTLLGKVLPLTVTGPGGGPLQSVSLTLDEFQRIAAEVAAKT